MVRICIKHSLKLNADHTCSLCGEHGKPSVPTEGYFLMQGTGGWKHFWWSVKYESPSDRNAYWRRCFTNWWWIASGKNRVYHIPNFWFPDIK